MLFPKPFGWCSSKWRLQNAARGEGWWIVLAIDWLIDLLLNWLFDLFKISQLYKLTKNFLILNDSWHRPEHIKNVFSRPTGTQVREHCNMHQASIVWLICMILVFSSLCDLPLSFRYIYSEESDEMTIESVMQTLYCAKRFAMPKLAENCREFVQDNLSVDNCCVIYAEVCSMMFLVTENVSNFVLKFYHRVSCNVFGNFGAYCCFLVSSGLTPPRDSHSIDWLIGWLVGKKCAILNFEVCGITSAL